MAKNKFLLLSLEDEETKKIAHAVSNRSCKKIIEFLTEKDHSTESDIAKALTLPISTVHYNLKQLQKTGLVVSDEYHYSKKGKEINHYKLANQYIIITPKKVSGIKGKLRSILPVGLISAGAAGLLALYQMYAPRFAGNAAGYGAQTEVQEKSRMLIEEAAPMLLEADATGNVTPQVLQEGITTAANTAGDPQLALWFIAGSLFTLIVFVAIEYLRNMHNKKG